MCPSENAHTTNSNAKLFKRSSMDDDASDGRPISSATTCIFLACQHALHSPCCPKLSSSACTSLLTSPLITISMLTYSQSVTLLLMLWILTQHHHPPHFILPARYYDPSHDNCNALSHGASFTKHTKRHQIGFGVAAPILAFLTVFVVWWYFYYLLHVNLLDSKKKKDMSMGKTYYIRRVEGGGESSKILKKKQKTSVGLFSTFRHPLVQCWLSGRMFSLVRLDIQSCFFGLSGDIMLSCGTKLGETGGEGSTTKGRTPYTVGEMGWVARNYQ